MAVASSRASTPRIDSFSRILIILASFFSIAALALLIVGTATYSWYSFQYTNGTTEYSNLFTRCTGSLNAQNSVCTDIARNTDFGMHTRNAAAFVIVAITFLGCGMFVVILMNFVQLTGILLFIAPISLFLATLFLVATFAEASRVMFMNSYSVILVQSAHVSTTFALMLIAFASGRLHLHYFESL